MARSRQRTCAHNNALGMVCVGASAKKPRSFVAGVFDLDRNLSVRMVWRRRRQLGRGPCRLEGFPAPPIQLRGFPCRRLSPPLPW